MEHVDVAIVGGGPAGSSAAAAAAAEGADAVVFEKGVPRTDRDGLGPDSTDAAGFLGYWVDVAGLQYHEIPDDVILQELDRAEFVGPSERITFTKTARSGSYPGFGFTFDRARLDDWLRDRAAEAGADYRVGTAVRNVESDDGHRLTLADGSEVEADALVLADGPQRTVTIPTLAQFTAGEDLADRLNPRAANHVAYQEYRRFPVDVFDRDVLRFWWGWMPGETAYPWVFPNRDRVARVGLTMPMDVDLDAVDGREDYRLLRAGDEHVPNGDEYVRRLLEEAYPQYDLEDFPLVEDRGKSGGTETYAISSTRPIDSPTKADVAVVGGAMGATSAFHEGGDHVAIRTGKLAGELAAKGRLDAYNDAWKEAIGDEVLKNVLLAALVESFGPRDWDRAFRMIDRLDDRLSRLRPTGPLDFAWLRHAGVQGISLAASYARHRRRFGDGGYVQFHEDEYVY